MKKDWRQLMAEKREALKPKPKPKKAKKKKESTDA